MKAILKCEIAFAFLRMNGRRNRGRDDGLVERVRAIGVDGGKRGVRLFPDGASEAQAERGIDMMKPASTKELCWEAHRYALVQPFMDTLRKAYMRSRITAKDYKNLRERALAGDKVGAHEELNKLLEV